MRKTVRAGSIGARGAISRCHDRLLMSFDKAALPVSNSSSLIPALYRCARLKYRRKGRLLSLVCKRSLRISASNAGSVKKVRMDLLVSSQLGAPLAIQLRRTVFSSWGSSGPPIGIAPDSTTLRSDEFVFPGITVREATSRSRLERRYFFERLHSPHGTRNIDGSGCRVPAR